MCQGREGKEDWEGGRTSSSNILTEKGLSGEEAQDCLAILHYLRCHDPD